MPEALTLAATFLALIGAEHVLTTVELLGTVELTDLTPVEVGIPAVELAR